MSSIVSPGIILKLTVTLAFCGRTFAAGEAELIVTAVVVRTSEAAGGIFFITASKTGFKSQRLQNTTLPIYDVLLPICVKRLYTNGKILALN